MRLDPSGREEDRAGLGAGVSNHRELGDQRSTGREMSTALAAKWLERAD